MSGSPRGGWSARRSRTGRVRHRRAGERPARGVSATSSAEASPLSLLEAIIDSSDDAIIGKLLDGTITSWNRAAEQTYGYSAAEVVGRNMAMMTPVDRADEFARVLSEVGKGIPVRHHETQRMHKDGRTLDISMTVSPIRDSSGSVTGASAISRDITDLLASRRSRQVLEARLRQVERMESMGQLAGGIAHDFNNLLGIVMSYLTFVKDELHDPVAARADLDRISEAAEQGRALTRQLLAFARREVLRSQIVDVNALVRDVSRLLTRTLGEHIEIDLTLADSLWSVHADPGQLEQVLMNLAVNSRDAMADGGTLSIETANVDLDEARIERLAGLAPGRYVRLVLGDTGRGMEPAVLERAFEPFFTTKPNGQGTGLGLPTVFGIVAQQGGDIRLRSTPGRGTRCRILLPAVGATVAARGRSERDARSAVSETSRLVEVTDGRREATPRMP